MDIQVEKLRQALDLVSAAMPRGKVTLPITTSVLFRDGKLTATNLEIWVSVDLPELGRSSSSASLRAGPELAEGTGFLLPHKALTEALKFIPGRQLLTLTPGRSDVVMEAASSRLTLVEPGQPRDFPPMPQLPDTDGFTVDGDRLVRSLLGVMPYVATRTNLPILTGVAVRLGEELVLAAADGFRLAISQPGIELTGNGTGHVAIVPAAAVHALGQLWRKGDKPPAMDAASAVRQMNMSVADLAVAKRNLRLAEDGNHISFSFGVIRMCSVLLQGEFPRYQQHIPDTQGGRRVSVSAEELLRVVNQIASIAEEGANMARLRWSNDTLTVFARAQDIGEVEATIPAHVEGGEGEIAFNLTNLQQYLRGKTHVVTIATVAGEAEQVRGQPGVFTHRGGPMVIMMPMMTSASSPAEQPPERDETPATDGEAVVPAADEESEQVTEPAEGAQDSPHGRRRRNSPSREIEE
jgi:DNA polymerase III sliding clamp (beta) subunit (PCNA family)